MKRLTKRLEDGDAAYYLFGLGAFDEIEALTECVDRLAAYEDTGLIPEEIAEADKILKENWKIRLSRLKEAIELIKAKDEGRLVVLPSASHETTKIVRCKNCKHLYFKDFLGYCPHRVGACRPDGFCDRGELREK